MLYSPSGGIVPLAAVARLAETVNTETIRRVDGDRTVTMSIIPPKDVPLEVGVQRVRDEIITGMKASGELPDEINLTLSGASDRLDATRDALAGNFAVALLIAYLLMVAVFSHWGWPLLIMTSVPIGISGGIAGLALLNLGGAHLDKIGLYPISQPFDMITMLGFLVLIGTVVNNPILIVERAISNLRDQGLSVIDAVTEAVHIRLRPIMMSMVTTVAGLSPLVFNPGAGTELYRGLGAIVLFGLLFSTLVTLTFIPAMLALVLRFVSRRGVRGGERGGARVETRQERHLKCDQGLGNRPDWCRNRPNPSRFRLYRAIASDESENFRAYSRVHGGPSKPRSMRSVLLPSGGSYIMTKAPAAFRSLYTSDSLREDAPCDLRCSMYRAMASTTISAAGRFALKSCCQSSTQLIRPSRTAGGLRCCSPIQRM